MFQKGILEISVKEVGSSSPSIMHKVRFEDDHHHHHLFEIVRRMGAIHKSMRKSLRIHKLIHRINIKLPVVIVCLSWGSEVLFVHIAKSLNLEDDHHHLFEIVCRMGAIHKSMLKSIGNS